MIHASSSDSPTIAPAIVSPTFHRPLGSLRVTKAKKVETIPA